MGTFQGCWFRWMDDGGGGQIVKLLVSNAGFQIVRPCRLMEKETLQSFILIGKEWSVLYRAGADAKTEERASGVKKEMNNCIKIAITEGFTEPVCQERPGGLETLRIWSKPPVEVAAGRWLCQNVARCTRVSSKARTCGSSPLFIHNIALTHPNWLTGCCH